MSTWTTKEGKKLNMSDMKESHIRNCIDMMIRKGFKCEQIVGFVEPCEEPYGDIELFDYSNKVKDLIWELQNRGLEFIFKGKIIEMWEVGGFVNSFPIKSFGE